MLFSRATSFVLLLISIPIFVTSIFVAATGARAPASLPSNNIQTWFNQLADADPDVRDAAREALMGLGVSQLDALRAIVEKDRPLAPAQALALHEIVAHVFLAAHPYPLDPGRTGFMGVSFTNPQAAALHTEGAVIGERYPGFVAYRMLRDGDVIVGVIARGRTVPIAQSQDLMTAVGVLPADTVVRLQVQRGGRMLTVPLALDPRPLTASNRGSTNALKEERTAFADEAEEFWDKSFAPLLDLEATPAATTRNVPKGN